MVVSPCSAQPGSTIEELSPPEAERPWSLAPCLGPIQFNRFAVQQGLFYIAFRGFPGLRRPLFLQEAPPAFPNLRLSSPPIPPGGHAGKNREFPHHRAENCHYSVKIFHGEPHDTYPLVISHSL